MPLGLGQCQILNSNCSFAYNCSTGYSGPCYRCLFPVAPKPESCSRCSDAGVLGVIPGIIGSLQALECIKILAEVGQVAARKLVIFDGLAMRFHTVKLRARSVAQNTPCAWYKPAMFFDLVSLNAVCIDNFGVK